MVTRKQMFDESDNIQDVYRNLQQELLNQFIDRIYKKGISQDNVMEWYVKQLSQLDMVRDDVVSTVAKRTGKTQQQISHLIKANGGQVNADIKDWLEKNSGNTPHGTVDVKQIVGTLYEDTFSSVDKFVQQPLLTGKPVLDAYQSILKKSAQEVAIGQKTFEWSLLDGISDLIDAGGFKSTYKDKRGNSWSIDTYLRQQLDSAVHQTWQQIRTDQAKDYDVTAMIMSSHPAARPMCAPIQGRVVDISDNRINKEYPWIYDYGYKESGGTQGINCRHTLDPFIPGVNENHQRQYDPDKAIENGKIEQKQRLLERNVRKQKQMLEIAEKLGDKKGIMYHRQLIQKYQGGLRQLIKSNNFLVRQYEREKISKEVIPTAQVKNLIDKRTKINVNKNNRHIAGTFEYEEYQRNRYNRGSERQSELIVTNEEAQQLVNKYGVRDMTTKTTSFKANKVIGNYVDQATGDVLPTIYGLITYSKNGTHITPLDPRKRHKNG